MTKIIIVGMLGKMGAALSEVCFADEAVAVVAGIDKQAGSYVNIPVYERLADCKEQADVVIDFSSPALTADIVTYCSENKTPLVLCTTGQTPDQLEQFASLAKVVPVFKSANMSVGVALLRALAKQAAEILGENFDIEIIEKHHNQKVDAPSGTALMLADAINESCANRYDYVYDRHETRQKRTKQEIGLHAVRGGTIVGEHDILFAGEDETITLSHSAASKRVFAAGAVRAAKFLAKQKMPGFYDMNDIVKVI